MTANFYLIILVINYPEEVETLDDVDIEDDVDTELDLEILKGSSRIVFSFVDVEKVYRYSGRS